MVSERAAAKLLTVTSIFLIALAFPGSAAAREKKCVEGQDRGNGRAYCCFFEGGKPAKCGECPSPTSTGCTEANIIEKLRCDGVRADPGCRGGHPPKKPVKPVDR